MLYYVTEKEVFEKRFERGTVLRVTDVLYECGECGSKTNKIILGGSSGYGLRWICPGDLFKSKHPGKLLSKGLEDIEGLSQEYTIKKFTPSARPI